jgi:hypothetical protein
MLYLIRTCPMDCCCGRAISPRALYLSENSQPTDHVYWNKGC